MSTVKLWSDEDANNDLAVKAVFDDIRRIRQSDFVNNFWRALANDPIQLRQVWEQVRQVMMAEGELSPLTRELIYIAVSTANGCSYCVHSHTASARAKGMTNQQHAELLSVIGLASRTNALATALQVPVDPVFDIR
ncbi:MAG: carboxymuconolactone decarboxylase family protein [Burkholderiales bacterium]